MHRPHHQLHLLHSSYCCCSSSTHITKSFPFFQYRKLKCSSSWVLWIQSSAESRQPEYYYNGVLHRCCISHFFFLPFVCPLKTPVQWRKEGKSSTTSHFLQRESRNTKTHQEWCAAIGNWLQHHSSIILVGHKFAFSLAALCTKEEDAETIFNCTTHTKLRLLWESSFFLEPTVWEVAISSQIVCKCAADGDCSSSAVCPLERKRRRNAQSRFSLCCRRTVRHTHTQFLYTLLCLFFLFFCTALLLSYLFCWLFQ